MSFITRYTRHARLYEGNIAWQLLRQKNAPLILSFIEEVFDGAAEVEFGKARELLRHHLLTLKEHDLIQSDINANTYLRQWVIGGWLREMNDMLSLTDACETALRFVNTQENRRSSASASRLRIVQEAVRDLSVELTMDKSTRLEALNKQRTLLDDEINRVSRGKFTPLSDAEKQERVHAVYQLAHELTSDFRRVEDEMREMGQNLREGMIEHSDARGTLLERVLEEEELLSNSDAGRAFDGFNTLLSDPVRNLEFREQLKVLLQGDTLESLSPNQNKLLTQLPRVLAQEARRVIEVRRRTEEGLRAYVERGSFNDDEAISSLLTKLEKNALELKSSNINYRLEIPIVFPTDKVSIESPSKWLLCSPEHSFKMGGLTEQKPGNTPNTKVLKALSEVDLPQTAEKLRNVLEQAGRPLTLSELNDVMPVKNGVSELATWFRVAKATSATRLPDNEEFVIMDNDESLKVRVPHVLLSAQSFPDNVHDLMN